jgi:hypothetical protein
LACQKKGLPPFPPKVRDVVPIRLELVPTQEREIIQERIAFIGDENNLVKIFARTAFNPGNVLSWIEVEHMERSATTTVRRGIETLAIASVAELNAVNVFAGSYAYLDERRRQDVVDILAVVEGNSTGSTLVGGCIPTACLRWSQRCGLIRK